jgi:hypothetical protein
MEVKDLDAKFSKIEWNEENAANIGVYLYSFHGFVSKYIRKSLLILLFWTCIFYTNILILIGRLMADQYCILTTL